MQRMLLLAGLCAGALSDEQHECERAARGTVHGFRPHMIKAV